MKMNILYIMTDTQRTDMVGAYGNPAMNTPHLDQLASEGTRYNNAYTACPLCTPARAAIFSGMHPQISGPWANNIAPHDNIPLMGKIFSYYGYRTAYSGKWHLDGQGYFGDGLPGGGFEPDWWYDGKNYADDLGTEQFEQYKRARTPEELKAGGFDKLENLWGHRVADRAIDFLGQLKDDENFVLAVSFDEPHGPHVCPPEYVENSPIHAFDFGNNFNASLDDKPRLQQIHQSQRPAVTEEKAREQYRNLMACNTWIDTEIGRVIDAMDERFKNNTLVIYTSDHGTMARAHGLVTKGPMMYEEITNIPFITRFPGQKPGQVSDAVISHVDIIPTMLEAIGKDIPEILNGVSQLDLFKGTPQSSRNYAMINWHRFAINHDDWGEFYPIRCATNGRYKLAINLMDTDEFYDLETDPREMRNLIDSAEHAEIRDQMHDWILNEMDRIRDPYRSWQWGHRNWRQIRDPFYYGGQRRNKPQAFPFDPVGIEAS